MLNFFSYVSSKTRRTFKTTRILSSVSQSVRRAEGPREAREYFLKVQGFFLSNAFRRKVASLRWISFSQTQTDSDAEFILDINEHKSFRSNTVGVFFTKKDPFETHPRGSAASRRLWKGARDTRVWETLVCTILILVHFWRTSSVARDRRHPSGKWPLEAGARRECDLYLCDVHLIVMLHFCELIDFIK